MDALRPLPISVCIIAGNNAQCISPALKRIADWTSEIIVLLKDDVYDGIEKVTESFGTKVFREPWKGYDAKLRL